MTDSSHLPNRNEVPEELTWNLTEIFADDTAWEAAFAEVKSELSSLEEIKGTLSDSAQSLLNGIQTILNAYRKLESVYVYASMKSDQDTNNSTYLAFSSRAASLYAQVASATSYFDPEILSIGEKKLADFLQSEPKLALYQHYLAQITRQHEHVLPAEEEKLLAGAQDVFSASQDTFNVLTNSDMEYPFVENEDGEMVRLSNGLYSILLESTDRELRQGAFEAMYQTYGQFKNTLATTLSGEIKRHNFMAQAHNYHDAKEAALSSNNIPHIVYDNLIKEVNEHLPLLQRYVKLRKKILNVDKLHTWDMYAPLTGEPKISYTYDEARIEAKKALAPLGQDYLNHVAEIFNKRYIDVVESKGKRSGAYSGGGYDTPPYELLNWQDNISNLYTLIHETGHSMHSWYTRHNQEYVYGDYPIFVAEIASTTNENILTEYLLKTQTNPDVRAFILNYYLDGFKGTIFRQTQFAEFEQWIHEQDAAGKPLTSEFMSDYYGKLNQRYYGTDLFADPQIADEWARIPHFYYNYYVYQYSTGFAAATTLADGITKGNVGAQEAYISYLKSGSSMDPIDTMKMAGVDMTKTDYLVQAFNIFEERLNELEQLIAHK